MDRSEWVNLGLGLFAVGSLAIPWLYGLVRWGVLGAIGSLVVAYGCYVVIGTVCIWLTTAE